MNDCRVIVGAVGASLVEAIAFLIYQIKICAIAIEFLVNFSLSTATRLRNVFPRLPLK